MSSNCRDYFTTLTRYATYAWFSKIVGPIFINESVNMDVYEGILQDYFLPQAQKLGWLDGQHFFQQDGAPPHCTDGNLDILHENFGAEVIARRVPVRFHQGLAWPAYSPDLTPCDYFLWGYVKDKVYKKNPKTIGELQRCIEKVMREIPEATLRATIQGFEKRLRMVIATKGNHVENIIH